MPVEGSNKSHVVLLTFGAKGHLNPFMSLARQLAKMGVSVTVLLPWKFTLTLVSPASIKGLDIKLVALPIPGDNGTSNFPPFAITMQGVRRPPVQETVKFPAFDGPLEQVLEEMLQDPCSVPPAAVVLDPLLPWAVGPVDRLGLPRYVFYTAATSHLVLGLHLNANPGGKSLAALKLEAEENNGFINVPGLPTIHWEHIGTEHRDENDKFFQGEKLTRKLLLDSKGILINTCEALDGELLEGLRSRYPGTPFIPVGPLIPHKSSTFLPSCRDLLCQNWLDDQPPGSVIYVSFGSWTGLGETQIKELALGLEASNKRFLWILPVHSEEQRDKEELIDEALPDGFRERVGSRGLIVPDWAPQHAILSHEAVGGFLTHCGWNSVMEGVVLAGVPLLAWPFVADQPVIARVLVDVLRVGVDICETAEGLVEREEIAAAVCRLLDDAKLQERARSLKCKVEAGESNAKTLAEVFQATRKPTHT